MTFKAHLIKYIHQLPIPESLDDVSKLSQADVLELAPVLLTLVVIIISVLQYFLSMVSPPTKLGRVNTAIKMAEPKVVDIIDHSKLEDVEKLVFCRCWKSKNYPFCDGAHVAHNKATGDNVGPLIVKGTKK